MYAQLIRRSHRESETQEPIAQLRSRLNRFSHLLARWPLPRRHELLGEVYRIEMIYHETGKELPDLAFELRSICADLGADVPHGFDPTYYANRLSAIADEL